jgi:uncharacterized lipoprotein YajG
MSKVFLIVVGAVLLHGCATAVAVVDVTASTAIYATKTVVGTTVDAVSYVGKKAVGSDE